MKSKKSDTQRDVQHSDQLPLPPVRWSDCYIEQKHKRTFQNIKSKTKLCGLSPQYYTKSNINRTDKRDLNRALMIWAPSSEFVSSSIPSWQILTAHAQPFRGARDLAFCLKVPLDSLLIWASSEGSGETARMRRLAWTFAARIGYKYQIRLTRSIYRKVSYSDLQLQCLSRVWWMMLGNRFSFHQSAENWLSHVWLRNWQLNLSFKYSYAHTFEINVAILE